MNIQGELIRGELTSADASTATAVTLFNSGSLTSRTLAADEYLEIHSIQIVAAAGGAVHLFIGANSTAGAGESVVRGTFNARGGIVQKLEPPFVGSASHLAYIEAPAGQIDVIFHGSIRNEQTIDRPSWREASKGQ